MKVTWQRGALALAWLLGGCQGGLEVATVSAAAPGPAGPGTKTVEVAIRDFLYEPATVSIRVGQSVSWTNYDEAPHDAVAFPGKGTWKTPLLKINESASQVFREPGVYPYYCSVHPAMRGTVEVRE